MVSSKIFFLLDPSRVKPAAFLETHCSSKEHGKFHSTSLTQKTQSSNFSVEPQCPCHSMALYHKACVEIDEEGAEAAAATFVASCGCARYMEPPKRIDFVADHPFLFLIREDKTGTVLFVGQIFDPSKKSA